MGYPGIGFAALLRRWRVPIALAVAGSALLAYAYGTRVTPTYEANAQVLVEAPLASGGAAQAAQLVPTYAEMVTSTPVLAFALRSTGVRTSLDELRTNVRGEANQDTRLITIRADDTHKSDAGALANGLAAGLKWYVSVAPNSSTSGAVGPRPQVRSVERATSAVRVRPRSSLLLGFGALAGVFGALALVLIAEARSPRVGTEDELAEIGTVPLLGSVNGDSTRAGATSLDPTQGSMEEFAAYRQLATRIAMANEEEAPRSLLVVGAEGAAASCAVASKLALALAHDGQRVVLAEFDEGGRVRTFFRIDQSGGEALVRRSRPVDYEGMILDRFAFRSGVSLVVALPRFTTRGLSLDAAEDLVALLSADADLLIIHGPPPSRSRGALTLARAAGTTLLVVRTERTSRMKVRAAIEGLEPLGTNLVGAVLQTGRV
jgi:capsular polysaccharide biosynthesis protein/Mrp family chromosome partitioning ATPase